MSVDFRCRRIDQADFDDFIEMSIRLMKEHPTVCEEIRSLYRYLLIDEFQDVSMMSLALSVFNEVRQLEFFKLLAPKRITVVGDDDQTIFCLLIEYRQLMSQLFLMACKRTISLAFKRCGPMSSLHTFPRTSDVHQAF